ncbi:hypothetical protein F0249_17145 [Vibrio sp. 03-59-1]|uniref:hypothetical protein n=1 Tax=Vibrio TaxID=662 RepID=UPI0014938EEF|nr:MULTISPECIES: hypothetical protein [Vibrio]MDN3699185.1 hypothetical protein [Vibrio cortegadensis]NOH85524.1 hypothetical protein [Vibrio sp. 03-59-1]
MNNEKRLWNKSELEAFGYHRSTIAKKLKNAGIDATAYHGQTPLYDVIQAAPYLTQAPVKESDAPDLMGFKTAAELRAYLQAQGEKHKLKQDVGDSVEKTDYEEQIAICISAIKDFKEKVINRIESTIPTATPEHLEDLERLLNFDLKAVADELERV